jgi:uncharacterized protein
MAIRAAEDAEIPVLVREGLVHLPTLGAIAIPDRSSATAVVSVTASGFTVRSGDWSFSLRDGVAQPAPAWQPSRWFLDDGLQILLEDTDPYRDHHEWPATGRLEPEELRSWRIALAGAWRHIGEDVPEQVAGLRSGLRAVTPLAAGTDGKLYSSTARDVFGAAGIARAPADALAVMIVHEFQHSKLGALLDLCDLYDPAYAHRLPVGWRDDTRPVEGVLQGAYAHLAVAAVWQARAAREVAGAQAAFEQYRGWTSSAAQALLRTGALTPTGIAFVRRMADTVERWAH